MYLGILINIQRFKKILIKKSEKFIKIVYKVSNIGKIYVIIDKGNIIKDISGTYIIFINIDVMFTS